ncbi:unnamed protein product [Cuscuta europaea]|uniref:CCR4-NOT transcription complex subunit 11 n=1 Tax=Cuscuta europaea TaxID=41803 RepID=A0A9P0ZP95_CUSEU|nr:unnamed protein product [Cuscuta europaea]
MAACDQKADKCERAFILHLLECATIKEKSYLQAATSSLTTYVLKKSFQEFMKSCDPSKYDFPTIEGLQKKLKVNDSPERSKKNSCVRNAKETVSLFNTKHVRNAIPDPDVPLGCDSNSAKFDSEPKIGCGDVDEAIIGLISNMSLKWLKPQWIRPFPPRLPLLDSDLVWLNLDDKDHHLLWDHGMCGLELLTKAFKSPLNPSEEKQILMDLETIPMLVYHCGLTPITLVELVEKNPSIAVEALVKLVNSPVIANYFTALVDNEMSPHSMKVVYNLTQDDNVKLPTEFIRSCITKSISSCKNIKDDESSQKRRARLVCVFIQNLIEKDNSIVGRELLNEVRSFCMQFSGTIEADKLLRLLGTLRNNNNNDDDNPA